MRHVYFREKSGFAETLVVPRTTLSVDEELSGPALIELGDATITVGPGAKARVHEDGLLLVTLPT